MEREIYPQCGSYLISDGFLINRTTALQIVLIKKAGFFNLVSLLKPKRKVFRLEQLGKCALAAMLTLAVFVSLLLSASPALHKHLHPDAAQSSHQCAITVFQLQHVLASNPNVVIVDFNFAAPRGIIASDATVISDYTYRFSASRAPPFLLVPLV